MESVKYKSHPSLCDKATNMLLSKHVSVLAVGRQALGDADA